MPAGNSGRRVGENNCPMDRDRGAAHRRRPRACPWRQTSSRARKTMRGYLRRHTDTAGKSRPQPGSGAYIQLHAVDIIQPQDQTSAEASTTSGRTKDPRAYDRKAGCRPRHWVRGLKVARRTGAEDCSMDRGEKNGWTPRSPPCHSTGGKADGIQSYMLGAERLPSRPMTTCFGPPPPDHSQENKSPLFLRPSTLSKPRL